MKTFFGRGLASLLLLAVSCITPAHAADDVVLRHAVTGQTLDALATLVLRFNDEQKGKARVLLQDLNSLDEVERRKLPQLAFLETDDSLRYFNTLPRFRPLHQVMTEAGEKLDRQQFIPLVADAVDDNTGRLQALPLGLSLPVLLWNKEAYRQAGLDPEKPPKTWWEVQARAGQLFDAGYKCPLTTSRFTWVHLENLSSQHGEPIAVREKSGVPKFVMNRMVNVKHLALLASWQKSFYFHYFGAGNEADQKFISGECSMFTGESALYQRAQQAGVVVGMASLPYYDDVRDAAPAKVMPDGEALWVLAGAKKAEYKVVARFMSFMLRPQVQQEWLQATGFLPMTQAAKAALKAGGVPVLALNGANARMSEHKPITTRAKQSGEAAQRIHAIVGEEVARVWSDGRPAKEALDKAMLRMNSLADRPQVSARVKR